jgi:site-specific DNA-methyltransferase (adenine-specific)
VNQQDQIICGDSSLILNSFTDNSIDLIITSPPYYQQRSYNGKGIGTESTPEEYLQKILAILKECVRIIKPTGNIVFNLGDKYENGSLLLMPYRFAIEAIKLPNIKLINQVTWVKPNPVPKQDPKKLVPATEPFFIFSKSDQNYFDKSAFALASNIWKSLEKPTAKKNQKIGEKYFQLIDESDLSKIQKDQARKELSEVIGMVQNGTLESFRMKIRGIHALPYGGQAGGRMTQLEKKGFTIIQIPGNGIKRDIIECPVETIKGNIHPAVYPEYIIQELISLLCPPNGIVLDPFSGSGTTVAVAKRLGRSYIGIEIDPEYCELTKSRLEKIEQKKESNPIDVFL